MAPKKNAKVLKAERQQAKGASAWGELVASSSDASISQALAETPGLGLHVQAFINSKVWEATPKKAKSKVKRVCRSKTHVKSIGPTQWSEWISSLSSERYEEKWLMVVQKRYTGWGEQVYVFVTGYSAGAEIRQDMDRRTGVFLAMMRAINEDRGNPLKMVFAVLDRMQTCDVQMWPVEWPWRQCGHYHAKPEKEEGVDPAHDKRDPSTVRVHSLMHHSGVEAPALE